MNTIKCLDFGFVKLRNLSGPVRRSHATYLESHNSINGRNEIEVRNLREFDADDTDPAITARISFDNLDAERTREQDLKLYEYLVKNKHTTPIEMIETWWDIKVPMAIGEQILRHRTATINKISGRYAVLKGEWYIPEPENVGLKSASNKQGRDLIAWDELAEEEKNTVLAFLADLQKHNEVGYEKYLHYLDKGIAPELCRFFLQANHYTVFVYKQDLHNLMHFLALRLDKHAQYENRVVAQAIYDFLKQYLPKSMELFDTYRRLPE